MYLESCSMCDIVCVAGHSAVDLPSLPRDSWTELIMSIFLPSGRMKPSVMANLYFCTDWDASHYNILRDERLLILKRSDSWCFRSNIYSNSMHFQESDTLLIMQRCESMGACWYHSSFMSQSNRWLLILFEGSVFVLLAEYIWCFHVGFSCGRYSQ